MSGIGNINYEEPPGAASGFINVAGARNGNSVDASAYIVLGQEIGAAGDPAGLLSYREIPLNQKAILFTDNTAAVGNQVFLGGNAIGIVGDTSVAPAAGANLDMFETSNSFQFKRTRAATNDGWADQTIGPASPILIGYQDSGTLDVTTTNGFVNFTDTTLAGMFIQIAGPEIDMKGNAAGGNAAAIRMLDVSGSVSLDFILNVGGLTATIFGSPTLALSGKVFAGNSSTTATATLHLLGSPAGGATSGPLKFQTGVALVAPEDGVMEYNGTNLFFTIGATRRTVFAGTSGAAAPATTITPAFTSFYGGNTIALGNPNNWASVVIAGTTFKIPLFT